MRIYKLNPQSHNIITSTGLNLINCKHTHYSPSSTLLLCVHTRYNLFAHSLAHPCFLLIFIIHSILYCTFYLIAHPTLFILLFVPFFILTYIYIYILLCYVSFFYCLCYFYFLFYYYYYYFFALSIERTCPDLHFTTDYTLYDCVCDK